MSLSILCVEDSPFQRAHLKRVLGSLGEVAFAGNGKEGIDVFEQHLEAGKPFELIILDLLMPEMDGQEMLTRLRELEEAHQIRKAQGVKVIILTGLDDKENIFNAFRSRCDAYLTKPIQFNELLGYLKAWNLVEPSTGKAHN